MGWGYTVFRMRMSEREYLFLSFLILSHNTHARTPRSVRVRVRVR